VAQRILISTGTRVTELEAELEADGDRTIVHLRDGDEGRVEVDAVFAAVGWPADLDHLDLDAASITRWGDVAQRYPTRRNPSALAADLPEPGRPSWTRGPGEHKGGQPDLARIRVADWSLPLSNRGSSDQSIRPRSAR
jgi:hypothetical protein